MMTMTSTMTRTSSTFFAPQGKPVDPPKAKTKTIRWFVPGAMPVPVFPVFRDVVGIYSLNHLFDLPYRLRTSIPVRVLWEEEMGGYVVYDDMFDWYGVGDNVDMALRHLAEVIVEDYEDLEQNAERLFPNLRKKLELMRKVLFHAS